MCVVIVNYRKPGLTIDCLKSIEPELADVPDLHVVVVDNASRDGSIEALEEAREAHGWHGWVTIKASATNHGFASGNNQGIVAQDAATYLLLNNDTIVERGALKLMLDALQSHPHAGLVGPRILDPDGTPHVSCFRNRTPVSEMLGAAKTGVLTKLFRRFDVPMPISDERCEPEWIGFACVLVRKNVFDDVGLLDEAYFMYFEDIDFCMRTRRAGWGILHDPRSRVIHLEGGSSDVVSSFHERRRVSRFYYESRARYFAAHYGGRLGLWCANVMWMLGRSVSLLREVAGSKKPHTAAHEGKDNWINWWQPFRRSSMIKFPEAQRSSAAPFIHSGGDAHGD
jgi:hypothetical protein